MTTEELEIYDQRRHDCWNGALHSYGYGYLYNIKSKGLHKILKVNTFLGIVIPIIIGGTVLTFGIEFIYLKEFIFFAGILLLLQLILSVYIAIYNLEDRYSHYIESSNDNYRIAEEYEKVGKYPPGSLQHLNIEIEKIDIKRNNRDNLDSKFSMSEKECRKGMRYSLRKYQRQCAGCNVKPIGMKPTSCPVCGNF